MFEYCHRKNKSKEIMGKSKEIRKKEMMPEFIEVLSKWSEIILSPILILRVFNNTDKFLVGWAHELIYTRKTEVSGLFSTKLQTMDWSG